VKRVIAVVVAVVAVIILVIAVAGIPTQPLVAAVNRQLEPSGYRLRIDGAAKISLWPSIDFVAHEVVVTDSRSPAARDLMTAESVRIGVPIRELLSGNVHITSIAVVRPVVRIEAGEARDRRPARSPAPADKASRGIPVDRVTVEAGTIVVHDARRSTDLKIGGVQVVATRETPAGLDIKAEGRIGEQQVRLAATTDASAQFASGKAIPFDATVDIPGLLQRPAVVTASLKLFDDALAIDEITGTAGGSRLFGSVSADLASGTPAVTADIELERLDLTGVVDPGGGGLRPGDGAWSDRPIDLTALDFFNASIKVSAREVLLNKVHIEPARVTFTVESGVLTVVPTRLELYGGAAKGKLVIDASGQSPAYAAQIDVANIAALSFLDDAFAFRNLDGRGRMKADLKAGGTSPRAIVASLGGTADITFENGEIKGVSIPQMVQSVATHVLSGWQGAQTGKTDFVTFGAAFRLDRGRATTDNMLIVGPLLRSPGKGTVDLNTLTLDFRVDPKIVLDSPGQSRDPVGIGVPVVIRGPWSAPQIYPELAGILDNPDAAYAGLKNIFNRFTSTKPGQPNGQPGAQGDDTINSLVEGIGSLLGPLKRPPSRSSDDPPPTRSDDAAPTRSEGRPPAAAAEPAPQSRADDQQRARDFLKNLLGN
jgi:AsmA protein